MSLSTTLHSPRRSPGVVALLYAAAWLGVAVVPCHAAPHAAPGSAHEVPLESGDCGHCPPAPDPLTAPCAAMAAGACLEIGPPAGGSREVAALQPLVSHDFTASPVAPALMPQRWSLGYRERAGPLPRASQQQRYCRYLI